VQIFKVRVHKQELSLHPDKDPKRMVSPVAPQIYVLGLLERTSKSSYMRLGLTPRLVPGSSSRDSSDAYKA
jgi:hypothetical protein